MAKRRLSLEDTTPLQSPSKKRRMRDVVEQVLPGAGAKRREEAAPKTPFTSECGSKGSSQLAPPCSITLITQSNYFPASSMPCIVIKLFPPQVQKAERSKTTD